MLKRLLSASAVLAVLFLVCQAQSKEAEVEIKPINATAVALPADFPLQFENCRLLAAQGQVLLATKSDAWRMWRLQGATISAVKFASGEAVQGKNVVFALDPVACMAVQTGDRWGLVSFAKGEATPIGEPFESFKPPVIRQASGRIFVTRYIDEYSYRWNVVEDLKLVQLLDEKGNQAQSNVFMENVVELDGGRTLFSCSQIFGIIVDGNTTKAWKYKPISLDGYECNQREAYVSARCSYYSMFKEGTDIRRLARCTLDGSCEWVKTADGAFIEADIFRCGVESETACILAACDAKIRGNFTQVLLKGFWAVDGLVARPLECELPSGTDLTFTTAQSSERGKVYFPVANKKSFKVYLRSGTKMAALSGADGKPAQLNDISPSWFKLRGGDFVLESEAGVKRYFRVDGGQLTPLQTGGYEIYPIMLFSAPADAKRQFLHLNLGGRYGLAWVDARAMLRRIMTGEGGAEALTGLSCGLDTQGLYMFEYGAPLPKPRLSFVPFTELKEQ